MTAVAPTNRRRRRSSRCGRIVSKNPAKAVSVISTPPHYTANLILRRTLTPEAIGSRGLRAAVGPHDREYELALILTDHDDVDYMAVADSAVAVFDTRAAYRRRGIHAANVTEI